MTEPRPIYPKHFFREPVPRQQTGFILMPFKDEFEPVHEAIRTAIENAGLSPLRADDIFSTRSGMEKILRGIAEAEVVVADMTGRNANVFYEAGIAHMAKENVVLLTQDRDDFPFDLQHIDHVIYKPTADGLRELTERLASVIRSLPAEPAAASTLTQSSAPEPMSPAAIRRELRRLLQNCEEKWAQMLPIQDEVFRNRFQDQIRSSKGQYEEKLAVLNSIKSIQPAFLDPWQPIEELGFSAIEEEGMFEAIAPDLFRALERAYELTAREWSFQIHPDVYSHSELLALRTWVLWGASALACRNWYAVENLLHGESTFLKYRDNPPSRESFVNFLELYYPRVCQGYLDVAILSIHQQLPGFAERHFVDEEEMIGYIGLWLLAVDIESDIPGKYLECPGWAFTTGYHFPKLILALESDPEYAQSFLKAVARLEPADFNRKWDGLRKQLLNPRQLDFQRDLEFPHIPERFAE